MKSEPLGLRHIGRITLLTVTKYKQVPDQHERGGLG